jgi:putative endonuclease
MEKEWVVYILECLDGSLYCGITNDVEKRMDTHKKGTGSKYVRRKGFSHLIATKTCKDRSDASKCECFIKKLPKYEKVGWFSLN